VPNESTQPQDTTEILTPSVENRRVTIGPKEYEVEFVQKPLSFFGKLEVFSVLGGALDKALSGPDGIVLSDLFEGPAKVGENLTNQNFRDADTFVRGIAKLVQFAPSLFSDLYVIFLGVPRGEREVVKDMMERPEGDGGLSDEDGIGILETFIDQNWDVMVDFFDSKIMPLVKKIGTKVQKTGSQPSKPSKSTRRTTPKP
jgi:hypothetical protein